jgi:hypothetical protein
MKKGQNDNEGSEIEKVVGGKIRKKGKKSLKFV